MKQSSRRQRGFTLIELMVVVAIIGILAGVVVGQYKHQIQKSKEAVLKENLYRTRSAIGQYFADKGSYPFDIQTLVDEHYLQRLPIDPITGSSDTWITIPADMDDRDISQEPGIADIQSGADGTSENGSAYSDW